MPGVTPKSRIRVIKDSHFSSVIITAQRLYRNVTQNQTALEKCCEKGCLFVNTGDVFCGRILFQNCVRNCSFMLLPGFVAVKSPFCATATAAIAAIKRVS